jgi:hypothetical protein
MATGVAFCLHEKCERGRDTRGGVAIRWKDSGRSLVVSIIITDL